MHGACFNICSAIIYFNEDLLTFLSVTKGVDENTAEENNKEISELLLYGIKILWKKTISK